GRCPGRPRPTGRRGTWRRWTSGTSCSPRPPRRWRRDLGAETRRGPRRHRDDVRSAGRVDRARGAGGDRSAAGRVGAGDGAAGGRVRLPVRPVRGWSVMAIGDPSAAPVGTGAYALDQSLHIGWLLIAALVMS